MIEYIQYRENSGNDFKIYDFVYSVMMQVLKRDPILLEKQLEELKDISTTYLSNGGNFWYAIDRNIDAIVGTIGLQKISDTEAYLKRYYVEESYRGLKIGSVLYNMLEEYAKQINIQNMYLSVHKLLVQSQQIYEYKGWQRIIQDKDDDNFYYYTKCLKSASGITNH